jgi:hypothetical protein
MGGMTWHHLQYMLGLHQMGHDVYFLEDSGDTVFSCYDPARNVTDINPAYGLKYAKNVFERFNLKDRWGYYDHHQEQWHGPIAQNALEIIKRADILINLSCSNLLRPWLENVPVRVLIDTDPVFTQVRNLTDADRFRFSNQHTAFFTYGENFRQLGCFMPDDDLPWEPTRQPVVLSAWPVTPGNANASFTTIMKWESYPGKEYGNRHYGMKAMSFDPYMVIPQKTRSVMEIAVSDSSAPRQKLTANGWRLSSPNKVSSDPWNYQEYIQKSKAEFSIAKHGYVEARTGWFSERSAGYLASGRPVVLQDTGFSDWLYGDTGVIPFSSIDEALVAIEEVNNNYAVHSRAARDLAETYFSSGSVLTELLERSFVNAHRLAAL